MLLDAGGMGHSPLPQVTRHLQLCPSQPPVAWPCPAHPGLGLGLSRPDHQHRHGLALPRGLRRGPPSRPRFNTMQQGSAGFDPGTSASSSNESRLSANGHPLPIGPTPSSPPGPAALRGHPRPHESPSGIGGAPRTRLHPSASVLLGGPWPSSPRRRSLPTSGNVGRINPGRANPPAGSAPTPLRRSAPPAPKSASEGAEFLPSPVQLLTGDHHGLRESSHAGANIHPAQRFSGPRNLVRHRIAA